MSDRRPPVPSVLSGFKRANPDEKRRPIENTTDLVPVVKTPDEVKPSTQVEAMRPQRKRAEDSKLQLTAFFGFRISIETHG